VLTRGGVGCFDRIYPGYLGYDSNLP